MISGDAGACALGDILQKENDAPVMDTCVCPGSFPAGIVFILVNHTQEYLGNA